MISLDSLSSHVKLSELMDVYIALKPEAMAIYRNGGATKTRTYVLAPRETETVAAPHEWFGGVGGPAG